MTAKQISVFLENKPGQLIEFARLLETSEVNMRALSLADAQDFGILRVIVDEPYKASTVLKEAGYVFTITPVLAVEIPDRPGSLVKILETISESGANVEYTYAFTTRRKDVAYMIFRVTDTEKAVEILGKVGIKLICQSEFAELFGN